ncbi:MAG TPA: hypothetical protein VGM86_03270 [Thermoanaerobaculia bacterium]|jgi:hypothetical protein
MAIHPLAMAPYRATPYDQILGDVQLAREWFDHVGVASAGTRLEAIEQTLTSFLADLQSHSLSVAQFIAQWDWASRPDAYYALTEGEAFSRIHKQLELLRSDQLPRSELRRVLQGPLVPSSETPSTTEPRNVFIELDLASVLMRSGIQVTGFDDVRFRFDRIDYITQCKRPFSAKSVAANVKAAWNQIDVRAPKGSHQRGIIALAVDKVFGLDQQRPSAIQDKPELDAWVSDMAMSFLDDHQSAWEEVIDYRVVAVLLLFRFICHTLPPVNTISAVHYEVLMPTTQPGTKDYKRLHRLKAKLAG